MKKDTARKDFDKVSGRGTTPLFRAVENGDLHDIRQLLEKGADVNAASEIPRGIYVFVYDVPYAAGSTPLHVACLAGDVLIAEMLLQNGADPDRRNRKEETPLDLALCNLAFYQERLDAAVRKEAGHRKITALSAKVDAFSCTVECLLDAGAQPSLFAIPDALKRTPPGRHTP